jgi:predicted MPP superfamily phosphohydrolase
MVSVQGSFFRSTSANLHIGIVFTAIISKSVFVALLLLQDGGRFIYGAVDYFASIIKSSPSEDSTNHIPSRRDFLTLAAAGIASIPLVTMLYGITKGKYKYTVNKVKLAFKDLPDAFHGFRIVQISDIHSGSFDDIEQVKKGVEMVNQQNADVLMFTGDMVNSSKDEINPFIKVFKEMNARYGKFSVLGNHDYYGTYRIDEKDKKAYWDDFFEKFKEMGLDLLNNENRTIEKEGQKIKVIGVENWGAGRWFPKEGDLEKALVDVDDLDFSILLSHDPTHWDHHVLPNKKHIHLTLSGHTHGFQFGIKIPGFQWSPAQYRYPRWNGLYEEKGQYLYVNRGFGFLGFPGRVGMWPEITVIELEGIS